MPPRRHDRDTTGTLARLRDVQRVLESDMTASPSLAELGRGAGASERTLSRLFGDELGMGYTAWRTQLRLHRAVLLLAEGRTVTQTAAVCGVSSPSAFASTFRAASGRTPGSLYR
ncbi:helix-turn-helix transcriptional regulator [Streptomyces sp. NPDC090026]|uniref:helix-turn-helix transcriptional regulator n=1 Tax=Streptomyces sp. NPDC090026 TaxID=3365923 RepID=UPI0038179353